jgi:hypothetical protein
MKRVFLAIAVLGLATAGCGGGSDASCSGIVDDGMAIVQDVIDELDAMTTDDLMAFGTEEPAFLTDMQTKLDDLDKKSTDAGCTDEELEQLFQDKVGQLSAKSDIGQMMIDEMEIFE